MSGKSVKKPSPTKAKLTKAIVFILVFFRHNKRAVTGDSMIKIKGSPAILCCGSGMGNIAGPAMKEYIDKKRTGILLNRFLMQYFHNPITKTIFKTALRSNPTVKIY